MDEKGAMMGVIGKLRVIVSKHEKKPKMTQDGSREWVTMVECVSLLGQVLSKWIIFEGKLQQKKWHDAMKRISPKEYYRICTSENGCIDNELGVAWPKEHFELETAKMQNGEYRMLLFDGHASHVSIQAIKFALEKNLLLLCPPPHTTHLLQPLDVGLFGPLATYYKNGIAEKTQYDASLNIDKVDFLEVCHKARLQAICPSNIRSAWRDSGISPLILRLFCQRLDLKNQLHGLQLLMVLHL
jgi:hypothetical protein